MDALQSNGTDNPWGCHVVISLGFLVTLGTAACTLTPSHPHTRAGPARDPRSFTNSSHSDLHSKHTPRQQTPWHISYNRRCTAWLNKFQAKPGSASMPPSPPPPHTHHHHHTHTHTQSQPPPNAHLARLLTGCGIVLWFCGFVILGFCAFVF